jgi:predicted porin
MRTTKLFAFAFAAGLAFAAVRPAQAQIKVSDTDTTKLYITLNTVGTAQALQQENVFDSTGKQLGKLSPGMQTAYGDLGFTGRFGKKQELELYFDLYLASRNHPSQTYGNEGYLIIHDVPENLQSLSVLRPLFKRVDVKAGAFLVDFGDQQGWRSNNAITQKNPLVGNFVIDPNFVSTGVQVSSKPGRFGWLVAGTNGTNTEDFSSGRGFAFNGKLYVYPIKPLRVSGSFYRVNHEESATSTATLFTGNRSGERYGAVLGGGQAPGDVLPNTGKDLRAYQIDVTFDQAAIPVKLYAHYGNTRDTDVNGPAAGMPQEKWSYYTGQAVYQFSPALYAAARYSAANANQIYGVRSDGKVARYQIGGGLWLTRNLLMKVEYVNQKYSNFASGVVLNNGIQAWKNPAFKGVVSEVSFSF